VPRGRKARPGSPSYSNRLLKVGNPELWDWAIKRAAELNVSLSKFIENLMRDEIDRQQKVSA
jgi:hypothetical protein